MKANSKKPSNKKAAQKKGFSPETARHEAAHFVTSWAVGCPALRSDITKVAQKNYRYDQRYRRDGYTNGWVDDPDFFQRVAIDIAGPVADNWGKDVDQVMENDKDEINDAIEAAVKRFAIDHSDWEDTVEDLRVFCDITDPVQFKQTLTVFIDVVREVLILCETQWEEVTEYLIEHGRIGFTGEKINGIEIPDHGEEAESFFTRWSGDLREPPKAVRDCVEKYRLLTPIRDDQ